MKVLPSKADPCIWLRKAPNLRGYEYNAVYVDDLCTAAQSPSTIIQIFKSKYHLKVKGDGKLTYHLGADYFEDPDGTFVGQPKKYIDKLADTYKRLFNEDPPKGYKTPLDKNDHPELDTSEILEGDIDRIPSTTPGAEPPRDAKDSGSARSHSTHLETSPSNRP